MPARSGEVINIKSEKALQESRAFSILEGYDIFRADERKKSDSFSLTILLSCATFAQEFTRAEIGAETSILF